MFKKKVSIGFKGKRNYIHGTDMFNVLMSLGKEIAKTNPTVVDFAIHKMTNKDLVVIESESEKTHVSNDDVATLKLTLDERFLFLKLQDTHTLASKTREYDETWVDSCCVIDHTKKSIQLNLHDSTYTFIEMIVAMNKELHQKLVIKQNNTSWVFCRFQTNYFFEFEDLTGLTITLKQSLGSKLTKSEVLLQGKHLGFIYFSAKEST